MKLKTIFALSLAAFAARTVADSYEEFVVRSIEGLEATVETVKGFDDSGMRDELSSLQESIDQLLEEQNVAAQRTGYYREKMNELDVTEYYNVYTANLYMQAALLFARAKKAFDDYQRWYEEVKAKCIRLRSYTDAFSRNYATPQWVRSNFEIAGFIETTYVFTGLLGKEWTMHKYDLSRMSELGFDTPNIKYEEAKCNSTCSCRTKMMYDLSGLNEVLANLNRLRDDWAEFNNINTLPD